MPEGNTPFPNPRKQITNFVAYSARHRLEGMQEKSAVQRLYAAGENDPARLSQATRRFREVVRAENLLYTSTDAYQNNGLLLGPIVVGMQTLMPEEVERSGYLESRETARLAGRLLAYQIVYNEELDFQGGLDVGNSQDRERILVKVIRPKAAQRLGELEECLRVAPKEIREVLANFIVETQTVEDVIKAEYCAGVPFGLEKAREYKSIVNAIYMNAIIATILGKDVLRQRLVDDGVGSAFERIQKKYAWLTNDQERSYTNNVERSALIMMNLAMAGQVDDDWYGREVDKRLGVPSFATGALEESQGDHERARELLRQTREEYKQGARELGFARVGAWLATWGQEMGQKKMHAAVSKARARNEKRAKEGKPSIEVAEFRPGPMLKPITLSIRDAAYANLQI